MPLSGRTLFSLLVVVGPVQPEHLKSRLWVLVARPEAHCTCEPPPGWSWNEGLLVVWKHFARDPVTDNLDTLWRRSKEATRLFRNGRACKGVFIAEGLKGVLELEHIQEVFCAEHGRGQEKSNSKGRVVPVRCAGLFLEFR